MKVKRLSLSLLGTVLVGLTWPSIARAADPPPQPLTAAGIENLFQVTPRVLSGSQPEGEAAFATLQKLGVKAIISVDGSRPDADTAHKYGLRYIHLPIGYDGIATNRVAELVKAAQSQAGPIFVHCHHGLHRGPAAVAVICEATAGWTTNQAVAWLKQAGTATDYAGLYRSAMEFSQPGADALARIVELPELAKTSSLVEVMVAVDQEFDRLKAAQKAGWSRIPNQPDLTPVHTATILWEHFRELARTDDTAKRPDDYRAKLTAAEKAAESIRALLIDDQTAAAARAAALQSLGKSCAACHKQYRN